MVPISNQSPGRDAGGFSLVETAIAMSIVALTLLVLMSLLGTTVRDSANGVDRFSEARIVQLISAKYRMMKWNSVEKMKAGESEILYFDVRGIEVEKTSAEKIYAARIRVEPDVILPGGNSGQAYNRRLIIEVSKRAFLDDPFSAARKLHTHSVYLVKMEK